jgi:hypothetical protein
VRLVLRDDLLDGPQKRQFGLADLRTAFLPAERERLRRHLRLGLAVLDQRLIRRFSVGEHHLFAELLVERLDPLSVVRGQKPHEVVVVDLVAPDRQHTDGHRS